jgi:hypothetical protein
VFWDSISCRKAAPLTHTGMGTGIGNGEHRGAGRTARGRTHLYAWPYPREGEVSGLAGHVFHPWGATSCSTCACDDVDGVWGLTRVGECGVAQMGKKGPLFRDEKIRFHQQFTAASQALGDKRVMLRQLLDDLGA